MNLYYLYITTNPGRTTLYVGITNNILRRLREHYKSRTSYAGRFRLYNLVYIEVYENRGDAIRREKEIKKWGTKKKMNLVKNANPELRFIDPRVI